MGRRHHQIIYNNGSRKQRNISTPSEWIGQNIGNAAKARFMDTSEQSYIYTTKNEERNAAMNLLRKSGVNLRELIEHLDAYMEL